MTYILEIPIINSQIDDQILTILGFGNKDPHLEWYFWSRNVAFALYLCVYYSSLKARDMVILYNQQPNKEDDEEKDVALMNQYEFAEFLAKRKQKEKGIQNITYTIYYCIRHPFLHTLGLKFLQFLWIFMYVSFPSWLLVIWILYAILELNHGRYIRNFNRIYFPLICICSLIMYVSNVNGVMADDCLKLNLCKFGLYNFSIPFFHLLLQFSIIAFSLASKRVYIKFKEDEKKELATQIKIKKRIANKKIEKMRQNMMKEKKFNRERITSFETDMHVKLNMIPKKTTYQIMIGFIISNWDIVIMTALYFAGAYQIDFYHICLMIFFVLFLLYPQFCRKYYL